MCATATQVYQFDGNNFVSKETFTGETITWMVDINDVLYVCLGTGTKYYYSTNGADYTQTDLTDGYAEKIIAAPNPAGTAMILWKYKTPNEVRYTTDGRTAGSTGVQWSSVAYIGDSSNDITNIFLHRDKLLVGKENNLFYYDSNGGTHPLMNDLEQNRSANNFKYVTEWAGSTYCSMVDGVKEITDNTFDWMSPTQEANDIGPLGDCVGIAGDKDFLYVAMKDVVWQFPYTFPFTFSDSEDVVVTIYKGVERWTNQGLRWEWCPWIKPGNNACATLAICQHTDHDRRLWYGYGNYLGYSIISNNPTEADSLSRFAAAGWIRMSYIYGTDPYWDKLFQSVVTQTAACTANLTVTPKYRKDTDTTATALTAAITTNGTVKTVLTSALSCNRIQFELHLATNDDTTTPEVLFFQVRGIEKPEAVRIHEATYRTGSKPSLKSETVRDFLRGGRTSTSLMRFADLRWGDKTGDTSYAWVIMEPGYPREVEIIHERSKQPELAMQVRMREVSFTVS